MKDKIGRNVIDTLDILAQNAFSAHPNKIFAGGTRANREAILSTDLFDPDLAELARTHLEEAEIPGITAVSADDVQTVVCATTPRVIHDIRTAAGSKWLEVQEYAGSARKLNGEAGSWNGVRFVKTNRLRLLNHGAVAQQTTLAAPTVKGQGSAATVDGVYSVGQSNSTRYVTVNTGDGANFSVGDMVTIHSQNAGDGAGHPPVETDGTQETRRIVGIAVDKHLLRQTPAERTRHRRLPDQRHADPPNHLHGRRGGRVRYRGTPHPDLPPEDRRPADDQPGRLARHVQISTVPTRMD